MSLGASVTNKTLIGTVELRIGQLNEVGKLTTEHSVGLVDSVKLESQIETTDKMGGFPQKVIDTAQTKETTTFTATLRETSRRNLNILLSNPDISLDSSASDVRGTVKTSAAIPNTTKAITVEVKGSGSVETGDTP